jgi:hypothetical protein
MSRNDLLGFFEVMELEFLFLVVSLRLRYGSQELVGLLDIKREQRSIEGTVYSKFCIFFIEGFDFLRNRPEVVTIQKRTHLIYLPL